MRSKARIRAAITAGVLATTLGCVASIGNRSSPPKTTVGESPSETRGEYRIETVRLDDGGWALLRYRPDTGEAWYSNAPDNTVWIPIRDTDPVGSSHYVFEPRTTGGSGWTVIRLDTSNGRTWITHDSVWMEVQDPVDEDS